MLGAGARTALSLCPRPAKLSSVDRPRICSSPFPPGRPPCSDDDDEIIPQQHTLPAPWVVVQPSTRPDPATTLTCLARGVSQKCGLGVGSDT